MTFQRFFLILLTVLIGPSSLCAQEIPVPTPGDISPALLRSLDEFRASVRAWEQTEVNPVMAEWKAQFDASLTAENRLELDVLRGDAERIEGTIYDDLMELREARKSNDGDAIGGIEEELDSLFKQRVLAIRAAIPFVISGQQTLVAMQGDMEPAMLGWQNERREQWEQWLDNNKHLMRSYADADLIKRLDVLYRPEQNTSDVMRKRIAATRFVLWNGGNHNNATAQAESFTRSSSFSYENTKGAAFVKSLAPNPADESAALALAVPADGSVLVRIYDARGEMVYMPQNGPLAAGEHIVEIPTARFAAGRYYYTVQFSGAQQSGAFSIVH